MDEPQVSDPIADARRRVWNLEHPGGNANLGGEPMTRIPKLAPVDPAPAIKTIRLMEEDGEVVRRFTPGGPFEAWLMLKVKTRNDVGDLNEQDQSAIIDLVFPNAEIARDHLKPIGHAVELLNLVLARAHAARNAPLPDAATCRHHVVMERFARALPFQATCDRCLTVLVPDVNEWLKAHDYMVDIDRGTVAEIIEAEANRGR